jgi:hypothetical protein
MDKNLQFDPLYPDVLGAIAGNIRTSFESVLQAAVGIFPHSAYLNQPVEVIVLLQSMVDQKVDVKVSLTLPTKSDEGTPVMLTTPKKETAVALGGGDVGVLRMPVVAMLPTEPTQNVPIRVTIQYRSRAGQQVRPPTRGAPPSALVVSPFKLQALRDVEWVEHAASLPPNVTVVSFDINPKRMPATKQALKPTFETLWTKEQMREERRNIMGQVDEARLISTGFTREAIFDLLYRAVDDIYALHGLPLHPAETTAITKMLTYTLDDYARLDPAFKIEEQRWFQVLCQVLAHDPQVAQWNPGEIVMRYLFEATMYDAILLAFTVIRSRVRANLGDRAERVGYANRVMRWLGNEAPPDLIYIYLPLVLGGVVVNDQVTWQGDDPWALLSGLREAYRGRVRLVEGDAMEIFDMLDKLLVKSEDELRRARTQR